MRLTATRVALTSRPAEDATQEILIKVITRGDLAAQVFGDAVPALAGTDGSAWLL